MILTILIKKEIANAFAQRKYIYMILTMSIGFPLLIPMFDNNGIIGAIIPGALMATIIPNIIALSCSSQLVANSHVEEVKSNISRLLLYKRINIISYFISKTAIPWLVGTSAAMFSCIVFHFTSGPLLKEEFLLITIANIIWSILPTSITLLLTILKFDDEVVLNTIMIMISYIVYGVVLFIANPFSKILEHTIISLLIVVGLLSISGLLIHKSIPKLGVSTDE